MPRRLLLIAFAVLLALGGWPAGSRATAVGLPPRLTDRDFWGIVERLSEPSGYFNSDNLVSNEDTFQHVIPELVATVAPGGVYIGVGPDQNFTYIAAINPGLSFITDIRRGNLHTHLMYKALIELATDRADFLSKLFSRAKPEGLSANATARELFAAFRNIPPDERLYASNQRAIIDHLTRRRGFSLQSGDEHGIEHVYSNFYTWGPGLTFVSNGRSRTNAYPTFETLQMSTDALGVARGYLASDALFQRLKSHHERNVIIPLVGNFAGPKALAGVADYVRERGGVVTAFYTSNVENYLFQDGLWNEFRANVARMPTDRTSTFIRSCFNSCASPNGARSVTLLDSIQGLLSDSANGRIRTYWDVLTHSRALAGR